MGCDIHTYVEYKRKHWKTGEEKWFSGDCFIVNPYYDPTQKDSVEEYWRKVELCGHRDYDLFATLAGVRDYSGKVVPVVSPRRIPDDCTDYVRREFEKWGCDGHTHSWVTLKELIDYNNQNPMMIASGLITKEQAKLLDEQGVKPTSWCQWVGGNHDLVRREWTYKNESLNRLIEELTQRANEIFHYGYPNLTEDQFKDIRFIFWFDN